MKRCLPASAEEAGRPRRRRQPQFSCNFCRAKKLKCNLEQPCSNCATRGIPCQGRPFPLAGKPSNAEQPSSSSNADILKRLGRLEDAVFRSATSNDSFGLNTQASRAIGVITPQSYNPISPSPSMHHDGLDEDQDLAYSCAEDVPKSNTSNTLRFRLAGPAQPGTFLPARFIDIPSKDDALPLFVDYLTNADQFSPVLVMHETTIRSAMLDVYSDLAQGRPERVKLGTVALILGICAAGAFFWGPSSPPTSYGFRTEEDATNQALTWKKAACEVFDQSLQMASFSLEEIYARLIVEDMIYNMEGASFAYRGFHMLILTSARQLCLHLVDLPGRDHMDDSLTAEIKRRIWWYIAATDWLLGVMGGPMDKTYNVHPKQIFAHYPSQITPQANSRTPFDSQVNIDCMLIRIRWGELCREAVDRLPLGSSDIRSLPYAQILALDTSFETALAHIPAYFRLEAPIPPDEPPNLRLQRPVGHLCLQARRARMLRSLLQITDPDSPLYKFRLKCLHSAEFVIETVSALMDEYVRTPSFANTSKLDPTSPGSGSVHRRNPYRSGLLITHLFMACAVLATDPALRGGKANNGPVPTPDSEAEIEHRRTQLAGACRLLEKAGEKSVMAAGLVKRLVGVLRKHRVHGVEQETNAGMRTSRLGVDASHICGTGLAGNQGTGTGGQQESFVTAAEQDSPGRPFVGSQQQQEYGAAPEWGYANQDAGVLTGLWDDFLGAMPTDNGWDQFFADLDVFAGPAL